MKHKELLIILILFVILVGIIIAYVIKNSDSSNNNNRSMSETNSVQTSESTEEAKTTIKQNSEIRTALSEKIEPHASYYLEEVYVEEKQFVEKGANILKYTNGNYLTAPYDCSITSLNLPDKESKLLNSHYVEIASNNILSVTMNIDEEEISKVSLGQEAIITVTTLEKEYKGYVTNIASTASNGKFKVTIEFENDGNIKLGMTSSVEMEV